MEQYLPTSETLIKQIISITTVNGKIKKKIFSIMDDHHVGGEIEKISKTNIHIVIIGKLENVMRAAYKICNLVVDENLGGFVPSKTEDYLGNSNQILTLKKTEKQYSSGQNSSGKSENGIPINTAQKIEEPSSNFSEFLKNTKKFSKNFPLAAAMFNFASSKIFGKNLSDITSISAEKNSDLKFLVDELLKNQSELLKNHEEKLEKQFVIYEERLEKQRVIYEEKLEKQQTV